MAQKVRPSNGTPHTTASQEAGRKAVAYARVSSKEQEKEGFSIPAQLKLLSEYARAEGFDLIQEFIDVETAKAAGRTQFDAMVKFLSTRPDIAHLLVEKTDRLYRNFKDYVRLEDLGRVVHLVKEHEVLGPTSRSHTKFIHGIKVLMAKNYIDNLSEEVRKGMREKAEQGGFPGKVPVGYINNKESRGVEIDSEKAPFIRRLFESYATGNYSLTGLRQLCVDEGFTTRRSEKKISRSNLEWILKNIFYTGNFNWNGRLYKGSHPSLVSQQLFDAVQEAFRRHNKSKTPHNRTFAFAGLVSCGRCGCAITAEVKKGRYTYYHCTGFRGRCGEPYLREEVLSQMLGEIVRAIQIGRDKVEWVKEALQASHEEERSFHNESIKTLQAQYARLQSRLDQAYIDKLDGKIEEPFWRAKAEEWQREQERVRTQLAAHEKANRAYFEEGIQVLELANRAYSLYVRQSCHEQRRLLDVVVSNCTLNSGTLSPTYKKPFDLLAKRLEKEEWLGD